MILLVSSLLVSESIGFSRINCPGLSACEILSCVAGVQRGGRGKSENSCAKCEESAKYEERVKRDRWDLVGNAGKEDIGFFVFLCPPDEHKNPDWSELIRST